MPNPITRGGLPAVIRRLLVGRGEYISQSAEVAQAVIEMRALRSWELYDENIALWHVVSTVPAPPAGQFAALAVGPVIAGTSKGRAAKNVVIQMNGVPGGMWAHTSAALPAAYSAPVIVPFADERFGSSAPVPIRMFQTSAAAGEAGGVPAVPSVQVEPTTSIGLQVGVIEAVRIFREEGLSDSWLIGIAAAAATAITVAVTGLLIYD